MLESLPVTFANADGDVVVTVIDQASYQVHRPCTFDRADMAFDDVAAVRRSYHRVVKLLFLLL